jgi:DNA-binding MarR family transcriptional regulator
MPALEEETKRFLSAWMEVRQIVQSANFNRFHRAGLSATQFMTLNVVPKAGMTLSDLARKLNLSAATLNQTVNSLEERGLVRRTKNPVDARKIDISATQKGEEMQNSTSQEFHRFIAELFAGMSEAKREGLLTGLEQMVKLSKRAQDTVMLTRHDDDAPQATRSSRQFRRR